MIERYGMSLLLYKQAERLVKIAVQLTALDHAYALENQRVELLQIAEEMVSLSDSALPTDDEDGIDLAELRRNALPDGSIPAQVATASVRTGRG